MKIITANRLTDGRVVFLGPGGTWAEAIADALVITDKAVLEAELARAASDVALRRIVEPYDIDVALEAGRVTPKTLRERIRATGPTVPSDFPEQTRARPAATVAA